MASIYNYCLFCSKKIIRATYLCALCSVNSAVIKKVPEKLHIAMLTLHSERLLCASSLNGAIIHFIPTVLYYIIVKTHSHN